MAGAVGISACALTVVWMLLPGGPGLDPGLIATACTLGIGLSLLLLSGRLDRTPGGIFHALVATGYALAWVGHFFFERNRPATFTHPLYSLMGDWVMWKDMLAGKISF